MWQNKNVQYTFVLENVRTSNIYYSNFELLKTWLLSNLKTNLFKDLWRASTSIVPRNALHNVINHHVIKIDSEALKQKCYTILVTNISKKSNT
jgi:hypothetical protein